jgi:ribosomal protein S18 acetylase RimI-like enzyme
MSTLSNLLLSAGSQKHLRPFDPRRDLGPVADLVEQCFADTLDPDGERYLQHMRAAAKNPGFLRWASVAAEFSSVPMNGYVWEEDGKIVGNVSLIPFIMRNNRYYLIANVAVNPDYRRRGIARKLTLQAVDHARRRSAPRAWLHVRENNEAAIHLYRSLGFQEQARRTTWYTQREIPSGTQPNGVRVIPRQANHWGAQNKWLARNYPSEVTWHLPFSKSLLRPGLFGFLYRALSGSYTRQWSVLSGNRLLGVLAWQPSGNFADTLWLSTSVEDEEMAAYALLLHARQHLSPRRPLSLDYPAHQAEESLLSAGFYIHQTLIWMSADVSMIDRKHVD